MLIFIIIVILLAFAGAAFAKGGGGSQTVASVGPKSKNLQSLENSFYAAVNPIISAYAGVPTTTTTSTPATSSSSNLPSLFSGKNNSAAANTTTTTTTKAPALNNSYVDPATGNIVKLGKTQIPANSGTLAKLHAGKTTEPAPEGAVVFPQPYDNSTMMGQMFNDATKKAYLSNARYDDLLAQSPGLLDSAAAAGDEWYDLAKGAYANADDLMSQSAAELKYANETDKWYSDYAKDQLTGAQTLMNTGDVPRQILDALRAETDRGLKGSIGSSLADLASRGVLNSSVTNKGMADLSQSAADSYNRNYLNAFNTALQGYQGNANTAANAGASFTDTFLNLNSARENAAANAIRLGESYAGTGSQRTSDLLNVHNANLSERDQLMAAIPAYFTNAASPMAPAYDFLQTMLEDHWNSNKKDTIVSQGGGGCFITSAVCDYLGKPDDCFELTTLRDYRDMWLRLQPGGEELAREYYRTAPRIVERLDAMPNEERDGIYESLRRDYIEPCLELIKRRDYEGCREKYISMVCFLKDRAGGGEE